MKSVLKRVVASVLIISIMAILPLMANASESINVYGAQNSKELITAFVTRLYNICLSREPEQAGLDAWVQRLESGSISGAEAAQGFMFSQEMADKRLGNAEFVEILYNALMGRASDSYGKSAWISRIETGGYSWHKVFIGFAESVEFNEICANYGIKVGDTKNIKELKMPAPLSEPAPAKTYTYSGNGDSVVNDINLPKGTYYAHLKHEGSRNFIVRLYYGSGQYDYTGLANEIGNYSGESLLSDTLGQSVTNGSLEVRADGEWTITIREVGGTAALPLQGKGTVVTGLISGLSGRKTVTLTHNGSSNFIVRVYTYGGGRYDYTGLVNEIGVYSGETLCSFNANNLYYFYIRADGDWTISIK